MAKASSRNSEHATPNVPPCDSPVASWASDPWFPEYPLVEYLPRYSNPKIFHFRLVNEETLIHHCRQQLVFEEEKSPSRRNEQHIAALLSDITAAQERIVRLQSGDDLSIELRLPRPPHPWVDEWHCDVIPRDTSLVAAEEWLRYMQLQWLQDARSRECHLPRSEQGRRHDWEYAAAILDAYRIVRHFRTELKIPNPPEEPRGPDFTLDEARIEIERVSTWLSGDADKSTEHPPRKGTRKRGGQRRYNPKEDRKIAEKWKTGTYRGFKDLAAELGSTYKKVKAACDRVRKHRKTAGT